MFFYDKLLQLIIFISPRLKRTFSKAANNWTVHPVKEAKQYVYIYDLLREICMEYCAGEIKLRSKAPVEEHDPRHIAPTIAPSAPPPTSELGQKLIPRIKGKQKDE